MAIDPNKLSQIADYAVIGSAVATVVLALVTYSLAQGTKQLVKATGETGERNAADNTRSYELTRHQVDLQSKADVYEEILTFMYDDFLVIQDMAGTLGIPFVPKAYGRKLDFDQKVPFFNRVVNRTSLHGSPSISQEILFWFEDMAALRDLLGPNSTRDQYGDLSILEEVDRILITNNFTPLFDLLKIKYSNVTVMMREELYPSS